MKRILLLILISIFLSSISFADEYVLVMSKDDNVCQHMLKVYNDDLKKYGEIKYSQHKEFNTIKWEKRNYLLSMFSGKMKGDQPTLISKFDINNDGKPEIIVKDEHRTLKGIDSDAFYVFKEGDLNYYQNGVIINDEFANKAIGAWGGVFNKKPFEGNGYKLYEIPGPEVWEFEGRKIPVKYFLGAWFYFHPFLYGNKYFTSMNDYGDKPEKWQVILYFTPENQLKDTCYFIKVCGRNDRQKGGK